MSTNIKWIHFINLYDYESLVLVNKIIDEVFEVQDVYLRLRDASNANGVIYSFDGKIVKEPTERLKELDASLKDSWLLSEFGLFIHNSISFWNITDDAAKYDYLMAPFKFRKYGKACEQYWLNTVYHSVIKNNVLIDDNSEAYIITCGNVWDQQKFSKHITDHPLMIDVLKVWLNHPNIFKCFHENTLEKDTERVKLLLKYYSNDKKITNDVKDVVGAPLCPFDLEYFKDLKGQLFEAYKSYKNAPGNKQQFKDYAALEIDEVLEKIENVLRQGKNAEIDDEVVNWSD